MIRKTPPNLRANPKTCAAGCMHGVEAYDGEAYCKRYEVYTEATDVCDDWEPEEGKE